MDVGTKEIGSPPEESGVGLVWLCIGWLVGLGGSF